MAAEDQAVQFVLSTTQTMIKPCAELAVVLARYAMAGLVSGVGFAAKSFGRAMKGPGLVDYSKIEANGKKLFVQVPGVFDDMEVEFNRICRDLGIRVGLYADPVTGAKTLAYSVDDASAVETTFSTLLMRMGFTQDETARLLDPERDEDLMGEFSLCGHEWARQQDGTYLCHETDPDGCDLIATVFPNQRWEVRHITADGVDLTERGFAKKTFGNDPKAGMYMASSCLVAHHDPEGIRAERGKYKGSPDILRFDLRTKLGKVHEAERKAYTSRRDWLQQAPASDRPTRRANR